MNLEKRADKWSLQHLTQSGAFEIFGNCKKKKKVFQSKLCRNPFHFQTELKEKKKILIPFRSPKGMWREKGEEERDAPPGGEVSWAGH